jgi:hypothetical protein
MMTDQNASGAGAGAMRGDALGRFFATHNWKFGKCLEPSLECDGAAIRAHSIQNAGALDLLAEDGHVVTPSISVSAAGPEIVFKRVGRNNASTFTGMCGAHDAALFRPIDTQALDLANAEQSFLLAYRSVTRELHAVMEAAGKVQTAYKDRIERGLDDPTKMSPAALTATANLLKAYETYEYRRIHFDAVLETRAFGDVVHDVIEFDDQKPVLALSSMFSFLDLPGPEDFARCVLNVVAPLSPTKTAVIFSYAKGDAAPVRARLDRILKGNGAYQRYELSRLILEHIENFVLAPSHVEGWGEARARKIILAFHTNVIGGGSVPEDSDMMLF